MTRTSNKAANLSNSSANVLTDAAYARSPMTCKHCGQIADSTEKAQSQCPAARRHFWQATGLERMASRVTDGNLTGLMRRMQRNGQQADRHGDAETVAKMQKAWNVYYAEALRRGLVSDD